MSGRKTFAAGARLRRAGGDVATGKAIPEGRTAEGNLWFLRDYSRSSSQTRFVTSSTMTGSTQMPMR
jgi:hypothetical protein